MRYMAGKAPIRRVYIRKPGGRGYDAYGWTCWETDHVRVDDPQVNLPESTPGEPIKCGEHAGFAVEWPGRSEHYLICKTHLAWLRHLAEELGVELHVWSDRIGWSNTCDQRIDWVEKPFPHREPVDPARHMGTLR